MIGDTIASALQHIGIQPCAGCEKRKEWLNSLHSDFMRLFGTIEPLKDPPRWPADEDPIVPESD